MAQEQKINLTLDELRNKEYLGEAFALSFEYLLAGVANEYFDIYKDKFVYRNSIDGFNMSNDLNLSSIIAYPFFIALANGHSEALFNLYGEFVQSTFGPISQSVQNLIEQSNTSSNDCSRLKYFEIGSAENPVGIKIAEAEKYSGLFIPQIFDRIKKDINGTAVKLNDKPECQFKDLQVKNYKGEFFPLYAAINSGILAIKDQSYKTFFNASIKSIMIQSRNYPAFQKDYSNNKSFIINYREAGTAATRPFYSSKLAL